MTSADAFALLEYHETTKHSLESVRQDRHTLDWANQPRPYKLYAGLEPLPLPDELPESGVPALDAIFAPEPAGFDSRALDLPTLAAALHYSAGITKHLGFSGGLMAFRAAACTGALYHVELYVVCQDVTGLEAGVYHYGVHDNALRRLRSGDFRGPLVEATAGEQSIAAAPATIVFTSTYWRNAWKYQSRTYRHCFWDSGTIAANLLAIAAAHRLQARIVTGFADAPVNRLIGVDGEREAALPGPARPRAEAAAASAGRGADQLRDGPVLALRSRLPGDPGGSPGIFGGHRGGGRRMALRYRVP
jgi:SagB-type dehydrogenase family enzyme